MSARQQLIGSDRSPRATLSVSRRIFFSFLSMALGLVFVFATGELAVRYISPQALVSDLVIGDKDVDYRLRPNSTGRMSSPEYSAAIHINSLGFRGKDVALVKKPGVRRVLFLGDSFTFGHGVADNEALPQRVGEELARMHPGRYEVINGGVYGYCTANELDFFIKYGMPLKPDLVIILVMIHDIKDNAVFYELTPNGELRRKPTTSSYVESRRITSHIPGAGWLREHSHLFKFVGLRILPVVKSGNGQNSAQSSASIRKTPGVDELSQEFYKEKGGAFDITTAILRRLAEIGKDHHARFILLTLGGRDEFAMGKMKAASILPHEKLSEAALASGFSAALALSPILANYQGKEDLFFPEDKHWTAAATKFIAPDVAKLIARQSFGASVDHSVQLITNETHP